MFPQICSFPSASLVLLMLHCSLHWCGVVAELSYFVDPVNGNDGNIGSFNDPFKTVIHARNVVRSLKDNKQLNEGVTIFLREGNYEFIESNLSSFNLDERDSGISESAPIMYKSFNNENVKFLGGKTIPGNCWEPIDEPKSFSKAEIYLCDLKKLGIFDYGSLGNDGFQKCESKKLELSFDGKRMHLARYPNIDNNGFWEWTNVNSLGKNEEELSFYWNSDRPKERNWTHSSDIWVHGYWKYDWADTYCQVKELKNLDGGKSEFVLNKETPPAYNLTKNARFYSLNILEELDTGGEYYVDRLNGILYFMPPESHSSSTSPFVNVESAVTISPNILNLVNVKNVRFEGIKFMYSRGTGGIVKNSSNIYFYYCDFSNHGHSGLEATGTNIHVKFSNFTEIGCSGLIIDGGDVKTLTRGNNVVYGNQFSYYSDWARTYNVGIKWSGVGNQFSRNKLSHSPHSAILGKGNDCIFEYNDISFTNYETIDSGAFYSGRSIISRGNIVRYNSFSNIYVQEKTAQKGSVSVQAIYLDDQMSGFQIYGNNFFNCTVCCFIGGGRRNFVYDNNFSKCGTTIHVDNRGMNWEKEYWDKDGKFIKMLASINYRQPPWSTHYPELLNILNERPGVPCYNKIVNNRFCQFNNFTNVPISNITSWDDVIEDNVKYCSEEK